MAVLEPEELRESPLADLHALASELGIEGYRRLRRPELVEAILRSQGAEGPAAGAPEGGEAGEGVAPEPVPEPDPGAAGASAADEAEPAAAESSPAAAEEVRTGILDVLPNGSGFLRADAFAHSREDVYVSPAQIRRCELRTGDEVRGPVRAPRRSERYPSLVRVETVNGAPAEPPPERLLFEDLTAVFASERLPAPEELAAAPFGKGSRVAVAGPPGAGATTMLRRIVTTLEEREADLSIVVVLAGARPEEVGEWAQAVGAPVVGGSFDQPPERQAEAALMAIERAKRAAERGEDSVVVIDSLEALPAPAARRVFGAARNTEEGGSVTVVAATGTAPQHARQATTRVSLVPGRGPGPELAEGASGTLRAELLA